MGKWVTYAFASMVFTGYTSVIALCLGGCYTKP